MKITFKNPEPVRPNVVIEIEQDKMELIMGYMFYSKAVAAAIPAVSFAVSPRRATAASLYLELIRQGLKPVGHNE